MTDKSQLPGDGLPPPKRLVVAEPKGFCAGVRHAVDLITAALEVYLPPVYCMKEIVHNRQVIDTLRKQGVLFVESLDDVPDGATLFFSAHGISPDVRAAAESRRFRIIDATCPFVAKVHHEVRKYAEKDYTVLLIGHRQHDEVIGVAGEAPDHVLVIETGDEAERVDVADPRRVAVIAQTTLSVEQTARTLQILCRRFPAIEMPARQDICYATTNRQKAVQELAARVREIVILGSPNSSNSNRLVEVARAAGSEARLVSTLQDLDSLPLEEISALGLTAGASTPDTFIDAVIESLHIAGFTRTEAVAIPEPEIHFRLPKELREPGVH